MNSENAFPSMKRCIVDKIMATVGVYPAETGGTLGAGKDGVISHYYFDCTGKSTENGYAPDIDAVNRVLSGEWMPMGIYMVGIVHSHSRLNRVPSCGDVSYGIRILQALNTVDSFYIPIVTREKETVNLDFYVIMRDPVYGFICRKTDYSIVDEQ